MWAAKVTGWELACRKARSARSLAAASTPAFRRRISTRSGCSCGSYEVFLERRRWQKVLVVEEVVSGSRRRPERDRLLDAARRREIDIISSGTYRFRDQRARLE